jgi:hypothetical protein
MQMLLTDPVVHHPFTIVFAPVRFRLENRQCDQHEQTYCKSDQTRDRFSVHGSLLSPATVIL